MPSAYGQKSPVEVVLARVIGYDPEGFVVRIRTQDERSFDTQLISGVLNVGKDDDLITGAGISAAPEEGSLAIAMRTSLGEWYTLGFVAPYGGVGNRYRVLREKHNQGDISISTRDGNSIKVLAGGRTDVRATSITGTSYLPDSELIHNTCRDFILDTLAGSLNWEIDQKNQTGSAVLAVNASLAKDSPQAILSLGHNTSGNLFEAKVSTAPGSKFSINKQGVVRVDSDKDVDVLASQGNIRIGARMIYLGQSGGSAPTSPASFAGNSPQVADITPSLPTPASNFPEFSPMPVALNAPDAKRVLNPPTLASPVPPPLKLVG